MMERAVRIFATFKKECAARYISHLDTLRTVQRALRRADIPVKYSGGYNPHPVLSFASALSVGVTSLGEVFDVALAEDMDEHAFYEALAAHMPPAMPLVSAHAVEDDYPAAMALLAAADYHIDLRIYGSYDKDSVLSDIAGLMEQPMMADKKSKAGVKQVDLRELVIGGIKGSFAGDDALRVDVRCVSANEGALNPRLLLPFLTRELSHVDAEIERVALWAQRDGKYVALWDAI